MPGMFLVLEGESPFANQMFGATRPETVTDYYLDASVRLQDLTLNSFGQPNSG